MYKRQLELSQRLDVNARAPDVLVEAELSRRDASSEIVKRSIDGDQLDLLARAYARCAASSDFLPSEVAARELRDALLAFDGCLDASPDLAAAAAAAGALGDQPFGARARAAARVLLGLCWRLPALHEVSLLDLVLRAAFVAPDDDDRMWDDQGSRACLFACASAIAFSDGESYDTSEKPFDSNLGEVFAPVGQSCGAKLAWRLSTQNESPEPTPSKAAGAAAARSALAVLANGGTTSDASCLLYTSPSPRD